MGRGSCNPMERHSAHQEPHRGASPHHTSMDLLSLWPFLFRPKHLTEVLFFVLHFEHLTVLHLQNISRARKRLLCCSVKSCSHRAESHLRQRGCTRPCPAQEHKGSYTWPPCSSLSAGAPGAFSGRFAWVQTVLPASHCCCGGTGEKGLAQHKERSPKLLLQPHSSANNRDCPHSSGKLELAFGIPARGKSRKWRHFLVQSTVLQLEARAMSSAQPWRHHTGQWADCLQLLISHPYERCAQIMHWHSSISPALGQLCPKIHRYGCHWICYG